MGIKHNYQSATPNDSGDEVSSTRWNEDHVIDDRVDFPVVASPAAPASGFIGFLARLFAGRVEPVVIDPLGLRSALQPYLPQKGIMWAQALGNTTTISAFGVSVTATGTATALNVAVTNIFTAMRSLEYAVTTAATTAVAGWRSGAQQFHRGGPSNLLGGFKFNCRFGRSRGVAANTTLRGFTGFANSAGVPTDVDPSTQTDVLGVGCDAADTNWHIMHRTGNGTVTKVNTGFPKAVADNTEMYELAMSAHPSAAEVHFRFTRLSDGAVFTHVATTSLPAPASLLAARGHYSVGGTSSVIGYALSSFYIETAQ